MKVLIMCLFLSNILFSAPLEFQTLSSDFKQIVKNKSGSEILYKGELKIKGNDKIKWNYKTPIKKIVYVNKNKVLIDEPELEQAITSSLSNELNIIKIINESKKISQNEYENMIDGIRYSITIENNILKTIKYSDELGNKVSIIFTNFIKNSLINDDVFLFKIPSNYDVIRK
ncbi:MAG: LolA-like outer membrane lipoprotein chaperone [Arcobacteraceae bacterium]|jgi:outer membrane lipoprotein carrier protein